ncbi:Do family serine endopeptidase [Solimonas terrae]|uniref:Probable periplasmic serine endoprotease DegP-like n=1 Tax=Solimonas terrae TaxID=1396819 RepID=A0A6M2BQE5_9GAMM|nr:Do family serine endopeptidase [Solimonas terrae]NGY04441.1 Do family serine endopeptidase [Solimonas terrae]
MKLAAVLRLFLLCALLSVAACQRGHGASAAAVLPDFADLVEQVSPSVVNISTVPADVPVDPQQAAAGSGGDADGDSDADTLKNAPEWFKRFLQQHPDESSGDGNDDDGTDSDGPATLPPGPQSLGSGFVLWSDGYVLTNFHVVRDAKEVIVRLLDRRQFTAQVVGSDEATDVALLKIDAKDLPAVKIGDATKLRPGQWALAIGSPFGFDYSVTAGIISAKGRALITEQYVPFIQTDVAINPGNSGGPLFNLAGEVIGMNSQIYSQSGGYQGLSFSIPIDVAAKVARQLKDQGKVTRGWLGVVVQEVDRDMAQQARMDKPEGALVARVIADSPAAKSGVREGDIILSYNGEVLPNSAALPPMVGITDPGEMATLKLLRDGKKLSVKVDVGTLAPGVAQDDLEAPKPVPAGPLGLVVRSMSADERSKAQVLSGGVTITSVGNGPAARAGIRSGDVLLQISGQEIDSPDRLAVVVSRLTPGATVQVLVQRRGSPLFLMLDVPGDTSPS